MSRQEMKFKVPWGQRGGRPKLGGMGGEREEKTKKNEDESEVGR